MNREGGGSIKLEKQMPGGGSKGGGGKDTLRLFQEHVHKARMF